MSLMKRSLFAKILVSLLITTTVPFLISSYLSYQIIGRSVKSQLLQLNQNAMVITMSSIHKYLHDISSLALSYYSDQQLMRLLSKEDPQTPTEALYINMSIERIFASYKEIRLVTYKSAVTNKQFNVQSDLNERLAIPDFKSNRLVTSNRDFNQEYTMVRLNGDKRPRLTNS
jgi:two-component system sensor histidine kinase YesM